jgi:GNAT superfamily N-acetyltransferase
MPTTDDELLDLIEHFLVTCLEVPRQLRLLTLAGMPARVSRLTFASLNAVGFGRFSDSEQARTALAEVERFFGARGLPYSWLVGSRDTPPELQDLLAARGLRRLGGMVVLGLDDLTRPIPPRQAVTIRPIGREWQERAAQLTALAFQVRMDGVMLGLEALRLHEAAGRCVGRAAFVEGVEGPAAVLYALYPPGDQVILENAATHPDFQRRGLFTALVSAHLAEARDRGRAGALIAAMDTTAGPICARLGFRELGRIQIWVRHRRAEKNPLRRVAQSFRRGL